MLSGSKYVSECIVGVGFGKCLPKFSKPREPGRLCMESRGHVKYITKGHPTQAKYGPREEARPTETMGLRSRMESSNHR